MWKKENMNPFTYGTVVKGENFYNREEECKHIVETLAGGNNLVFYAPRRFGKTSFAELCYLTTRRKRINQ